MAKEELTNIALNAKIPSELYEKIQAFRRDRQENDELPTLSMAIRVLLKRGLEWRPSKKAR